VGASYFKIKQGYTSSVTRAGHALFLDFALALSRSFLDPQFRAFAFALSRPALSYYSHFFSRYSIFRAPRFFALVHLRFLIFVLVILCSCVYIRPGQDSQDRTARTGHPEQDTQNRTPRTGHPEQDTQNRTARTGQPGQDSQNKTATMGQVEQDCLDRIAKTGHPGHEC
jgi:hypothetical protein